MARKPNDQRPTPPIVYAYIAELKIYELSEAELDQLAAGSSDQLHLNFALAMLPTALTILITLQTAELRSDRVYVAYLVAFWALVVQGSISLVRWWRSRSSYNRLIETIRARMPVRPGVAEQLVASAALGDPGSGAGTTGAKSDG